MALAQRIAHRKDLLAFKSQLEETPDRLTVFWYYIIAPHKD